MKLLRRAQRESDQVAFQVKLNFPKIKFYILGDNTDNSTKSKKPKLQVTNHLPIAETVIAVEKVENGRLEFHMKMMNVDKLHVFSAEEAHMQYPLLVIEFYEKRLFWKAPERQDI